MARMGSPAPSLTSRGEGGGVKSWQYSVDAGRRGWEGGSGEEKKNEEGKKC